MSALKEKVLVAMSGGLDSSVTAMLLHEQGYEVIGLTMKTWDYASSGGNRKTTGCCSLDDINDARILAVQLGFHHMILDIKEEFGDYIIDNFVDEYIAGRTPNPCVLCNTHIKWDALLRRADQLGCKYIATGHYARIRLENGRYIVSKGRDENKDQSYVLWGLSQESLARTMFPLGEYTKDEIRELARQRGYNDIAGKKESYEICFVPDNDYRSFLKRRIPGLEAKVDGGDFVDSTGKVLGKHKGYPFYTVGQRKGLEIALGEPQFVLEINVAENKVVLGTKEELKKSYMKVRNANLIKYAEFPAGEEILTKIRYKDKGAMSTVKVNEKGELEVEFYQDVMGVAPGQSAVFYENDDLIGGGFIV